MSNGKRILATRVSIDQGTGSEHVERSVLAATIIVISRAMQKLLQSGLNRKAIIVLVAHSSKRPQREVADIIDAIEQLEKDYVS